MNPTEQRFWKHVKKTETCWLWTASLHRKYGRFQTGTFKKPKMVFAHRFAMELAGIDVTIIEAHHVCRNRSCVRVHPEHVVPVPRHQNPDDPAYLNTLKTHCPRGHLLTDDNLVPSQKVRGERRCAKCNRTWSRIYQRKRRRAYRESRGKGAPCNARQ
jgi:hypothetical protein